MVQGTASGVGKSLLVAGLCRVLLRRGASVAPFKPQNMSLNSAVSSDGGELGRAQALQAQAAGLEPHSDMNPVLLKPNSDRGAQLILGGQVHSEMDARAFHSFKSEAMAYVLASFGRLRQQHELILVEGAGSPAEINLRQGDIANMGFAEAVDCPVLLVADIDRGGVFAQLAGTLALLEEGERARLRGLVINRFRGDPGLLEPGLDWLREYTGKPLLGVLPFLEDLQLPPEDALHPGGRARQGLRVVVPAPPRISNHSDFVPLQLHPEVDFVFSRGAPQAADLLILAGSKSVRADLEWLRGRGWDAAVFRHLRYGGKLIGICGGFQMLGQEVADPLGREGPPGSAPGLGLLDFHTRIGEGKLLRQVREGHFAQQPQVAVRGYEIHAGRSTGPALQHPALFLEGRGDGALSKDNHVLGSYLHGLFDEAAALQWLLSWAGLKSTALPSYQERVEKDLDRLADALEQSLDLQQLLSWL